MSHENAPATRLVATHCWACHRDLVDAKSVEVGMGPICRKKYGYDELSGLDNATRKAANALVYEAAAVHATAPDRVIAIADELATLGLVKLPEKMRDNFIPIKLTTVPNAPVYRYQGRAKGETQVGTADIVQVKTGAGCCAPGCSTSARCGIPRPGASSTGRSSAKRRGRCSASCAPATRAGWPTARRRAPSRCRPRPNSRRNTPRDDREGRMLRRSCSPTILRGCRALR